MKKFVCVVLSILSLFVFASCAGKVPLPGFEAPSEGVLGTENMDEKLRLFLNVSEEYPNGDMGERRAFSESEKKMAAHIENTAKSITDGDGSFEVAVHPFSVSGYGESQNVIARKNGEGGQLRKTVVFCANYDGFIQASLGDNQTVSSSVGAMENGTGCAVLLALMEYTVGRTYEFDIEFAFFGDGVNSNSGASQYLNEMSASKRDNILLAFAPKRLGGDNVYMYSEEVETEHEEYLFSLSSDGGLGINRIPGQMPVIKAQALKRLPYAHWALAGVHAPFMDAHVPVAALFSANYETLNLSDIESANSQIISYTVNDTYTRLKKDFPSYSSQMSASANLMARALESPDFESVMISSRQNFRNYDAWTKKLIAQLVVVALLVALGVTVIIVAKKLEKKYPYTPPKLKKVKLAVFGTDYESGDADVVIDVKKPDGPFDGY